MVSDNMPSNDCSTVRIRDIDGAVIYSTPNTLWANSACLMKFESDDDFITTKKLMINFEKLEITDCAASLKIYFARSSSGKPPDVSEEISRASGMGKDPIN